MIATHQNTSPNSPTQHPNTPYNTTLVAISITYKECLKNHAASLGGNAVDGCGEFMPSRSEDPSEALNCSACGCHRNFHRKEVEGEINNANERRKASQLGQLGSLEMQSESDHDHKERKRRFRTKFTQEQKEKLLRFADKAGWRMQKLDECVVQQFCQEIGINRKVLKVWMHNNKHTYANKLQHF